MVDLKNFQNEVSIVNRTCDCYTYFEQFPVKALQDVDYDPDFPMAFSIIVHKEIAIFELFLSLIYRPHNFYCIYVDKKVPKEVFDAVQSLIACYQNMFGKTSIFILENRNPIFWGHYSILEADLSCLERLDQMDNDWKYFMNTAGTELPNVAYGTIEATAKQANGQNVMDRHPIEKKFLPRVDRYHIFRRFGPNKYDLAWHATRYALPKPPFGIKIFKGLKNVLISRRFATFALYHPIAQDFRDWIEDVGIPDEIFFHSLESMGQIEQDNITTFLDWNMASLKYGMTRYTEWENSKTPLISPFSKRVCYGKIIRWLCNFGVADLPRVWKAKALMINKFNLNVDPLAPLCQWRHVWDLNADL
eukprot:TCALIF_11260-PA protein Name:"Similar to GCNT3 Beta-1,3-galactosyl-O-glycosyl-glycoprotein beta-1,6-N-acetylglucosaminyltransferase 3 (Ovis aries)" AED:0.17 eAED:0.20 QI:0/0/0/0.75/1/1/4/0/360